jgi:predicted enzyme related to lactoylglutathione lyase
MAGSIAIRSHRWFDITTTNLPQSKEFYGKLFDWQFTALQGTDQAAEIVPGGTAVGTLRVAESKISPFNGVVYVQVPDIRAGCKKVSQLGGTVVPGFPFNLPDGTGAIAVVVDPAGTRSACTRGPRSLPRRPRQGEETGSFRKTLIAAVREASPAMSYTRESHVWSSGDEVVRR